MLEELHFCQVRDNVLLYLSYVTAESALWLVCFGSSPPCTWTRGRWCVYWTSLPSTGRMQCDLLVWYAEFIGGATLLLWEVNRWLRCLTPSDPNLINYQWKSLGPPFQLSGQPLPSNIPLFQAYSTMSPSTPSLPPVSTWDILLLLCSSSLLREERALFHRSLPSSYRIM